MKLNGFIRPALFALALSTSLMAQTLAPNVRILLPERTRLLQGQQFDLVLEVRNADAVSNLKVTAGDIDLTSKFTDPVKALLDCDDTSDWVIRAICFRRCLLERSRRIALRQHQHHCFEQWRRR